MIDSRRWRMKRAVGLSCLLSLCLPLALAAQAPSSPDGRIEGTVFNPPSLWMKSFAEAWVFYPLFGEPLLKR